MSVDTRREMFITLYGILSKRKNGAGKGDEKDGSNVMWMLKEQHRHPSRHVIISTRSSLGVRRDCFLTIAA